MGRRIDPNEGTIEVLRYGINTNREWLRGLQIVEIGTKELEYDRFGVDTVYPAISRLVRQGIVRQGKFVFPNGNLLTREARISRQYEPGLWVGPVSDDFLEPYESAGKVQTPSGKMNPHGISIKYRLSQYGETMPVVEPQIVEQGRIIPGLAMPDLGDQNTAA